MREDDPLLRKQVVKLGGAQVIEKIGGRDRVRTCDPLLAKRGRMFYCHLLRYAIHRYLCGFEGG